MCKTFANAGQPWWTAIVPFLNLYVEVKISGGISTIPQRDLRASKAMNAFFIAPAISGATLKTLTATHPSLEQRLEQLARIQAELGRPAS